MTQQASTPFTNTSAGATVGLGASIAQVYDVTALAATGNIVIQLPVACTKIQVRSKSTAVNAATTILRGAVTVSDGANVVRVQPAASAATAAGQNFDENFDVYTDIQVTQITIPYTLAGATTVATIDTEVFGNP
jgi:hypothetical protein